MQSKKPKRKRKKKSNARKRNKRNGKRKPKKNVSARKKPKRNASPKNSARKSRLSAIRWLALSEWEARKVTAKAMPHPEPETRAVRSVIPIMELTKV